MSRMLERHDLLLRLHADAGINRIGLLRIIAGFPFVGTAVKSQTRGLLEYLNLWVGYTVVLYNFLNTTSRPLQKKRDKSMNMDQE